MTREEEINNASYAYWVNNYANVEFIDEEEKEFHTQDIQESFINGAKWADAHPGIDVRTMAAWQSGYKEAIDKACEWIGENMNDVGIRFMRGDEIKDIVDLFRKAMKGGKDE